MIVFSAALMKNSGSLFANDANEDRTKAIVSNLHRMGVHNAVVSSYDARVFPKVSSHDDYIFPRVSSHDAYIFLKFFLKVSSHSNYIFP